MIHEAALEDNIFYGLLVFYLELKCLSYFSQQTSKNFIEVVCFPSGPSDDIAKIILLIDRFYTVKLYIENLAIAMTYL